MAFVTERAPQRDVPGCGDQASYDRDFAFGLELILDGLERLIPPEGSP